MLREVEREVEKLGERMVQAEQEIIQNKNNLEQFENLVAGAEQPLAPGLASQLG